MAKKTSNSVPKIVSGKSTPKVRLVIKDATKTNIAETVNDLVAQAEKAGHEVAKINGVLKVF